MLGDIKFRVIFTLPWQWFGIVSTNGVAGVAEI